MMISSMRTKGIYEFFKERAGRRSGGGETNRISHRALGNPGIPPEPSHESPKLNQLIPPEIKNDQFYFALNKIAADPKLRTFLEIGSSSGEGSTEAIVKALRARVDRAEARLFCMETSSERFAKLRDTYAADAFVRPYNLPSVSTEQFPSEEAVIHFYNTVRTNLDRYPLPTVLGWLRADIEYIRSSGRDRNGVEIIKKENEISRFDFVLIDGSEFTGEPDFYAVAGADVIACDDINAFKCFNVYRMLKNNTSYRLLVENPRLRNGFAVFARAI